MAKLQAFLLAITTLALSLSACGQESGFPARYIEGVHYTALPKPVPVIDPEKIEVVEVFWYACGHCYNFEPSIRKYEEHLAEDVNFVRIPAIWQPIMETHARIFYTAKQLGILDDVHQAIFNAIHLNGKTLQSANEVADLFAQFGADRDAILKTFDSAEVTKQLRDDNVKVRGYQITGTPQLIVQGLYRVEANRSLAQDDMLKVVDFLVDKVRHEQ